MLKKVLIGLASLIVLGGVAFALLFNSSFNKYQARSKEALVKMQLMRAYSAAEMYKAMNGAYATDSTEIEGFPPSEEVTVSYQSDGQTYTIMGSFEDIRMTMDHNKVLRDGEGNAIE